jgi:hypothetical protein
MEALEEGNLVLLYNSKLETLYLEKMVFRWLWLYYIHHILVKWFVLTQRT